MSSREAEPVQTERSGSRGPARVGRTEGPQGPGHPVASCRWWAGPRDGPGMEQHQVRETQAPENNSEPSASLHAAVPRLPEAVRGIKDGANAHGGPGRTRPGAHHAGPRRRERNRPGPGRCGRCPVRTDRGLGSGRQRTGWAGRGQLCVCRRLCRGLGKDRFPGPGRRPGSKAKEVRSRRAGRQVGLGLAEEAAAGTGRVSSPVGEGGVPRGLAAAAT